MKQFLFVLSVLTVFIYLGSCKKSNDPGYTTCTGPSALADSTVLLKFASDHNITPTRDSTGLIYQIIDSGSGPAVTINSRIFVSYIGTLMDGSVIDSTTNYAATGFPLTNLIAGWQIGIPKIKQGGRIKLLIPSAYAYGCAGSSTGIVPPNAQLYFDVNLVQVQ